MTKRILGLDFGSKTVGVAISDPLLMTAQEHSTITRKKPGALRDTLRQITDICLEYDIGLIVIGLPLNMDGSEGDRCVLTRDFAQQVEDRTGLEILFWDERLTTCEADEILRESGVVRSKRKQFIDQVAAAIVLQEYLDERRKQSKTI